MAPLRYTRRGPFCTCGRRWGPMLGEEPPGADSGVGQTAQPLGSGWDVIPRAESPLFIYSIPTVQIPSLPPPPRIDRAPDSCSPDHGVALCMISCWFSRHCFSLSSVSVSRCSRMETVCKIMGGPAQRGQGSPGCPGDALSQSCSATPACCPNASCRLCPPGVLPGPLVAVGRACAFMSTPAGSEQLSGVCGRG